MSISTVSSANLCSGGSYLEGLGRQSDGSLDAQILGLRTLEELGADFLERLDFAGCEGDADFVNFLLAISSALPFLRCHCCAGLQGRRRNHPSLAFGTTCLRCSI